jgi:hypothetical protein
VRGIEPRFGSKHDPVRFDPPNLLYILPLMF